MDYDLIDSILHDMGMSRRKLAELAGISENTLSAAFRRKSKNTVEMAMKIAPVLGVEWWKLMGWEDLGNGIYGLSATPEEVKRFSEQMWGKKSTDSSNDQLQQIVVEMEKLNIDGQREAVRQVSLLTKIPEYQKE